MSKYGPDEPCQRTACAGPVGPHEAGRHFNPRDELYDGPHGTLQVLPLAVRESARKLIREAPALMPEVVDLARHVEFLRGQVAAVQVDGDRRERAALLRSESCEQHGKDIEELGRQVHAMDWTAQANDAGRVALLGFLQVVEDFVRSHRAGKTNEDLTVDGLVDALDKAAKRASAAHMRAWKR